MSKNQFTGTATKPQCNRNFFFNLIRTSTVLRDNSPVFNRNALAEVIVYQPSDSNYRAL